MTGDQKQITINAPVEHVFGVITDYEKYPEFLPEMTSVEILSCQDGVTVARFELYIMMRFSYILELEEHRPQAVKWSLREARMINSNDGLWEFRSSNGGRTYATYKVDVQLPGVIPASVSDRLTGIILPQTLQMFKDRCELLLPVGGD